MKIAFLNPVNYLDIGIPQGIALLSAIVKEHGHEAIVIDTAFMKTGVNILVRRSRLSGVARATCPD